MESVLDAAWFAASDVNTQPWRVHVITGQAKDRICAAIQRVNRDSASDSTCQGREYYPREWTSPYIERRRPVGWKLYGLLGIEKVTRTECRLNGSATINSSTRR